MATTKSHSSPPPTPPLADIKRGTPSPELRRPKRSPSPDCCPICLDVFDSSKDRSYSDNCYHIFCFECLLEWSNNKRECPLCKKPFKSIIHKIKSHDDYKVHKLPPPAAEPEFRMAWSNVTWEWMGRLRREFILSRQRQLERIRNGTARHNALGTRSVLRAATADRRRFIYQHGLFCEGANVAGGGTRYRRTTPDFYRRNPAIIHRLVPWLNRELVAVLAHRDNVQSVLDHILSEIRRVDLRSSEFRRSIQPFILGHTDHFIHEFHQFAMSPMDMAAFDNYARYPPRPRSSRRARRRSESSQANDRVSVSAQPPRDSSSSDSDIDVITRVADPSLSAPSSSTSYRSVPPPSLDGGHGGHRMSWHRQRLISAELGNGELRAVRRPIRSTRWDTTAASSSATRHAVGSAVINPLSSADRLTPRQREARNRLERSLRNIANSASDLRTEPASTSTGQSSASSSAFPPIVSRVRSFLENIDDELSNDGVRNRTSLSMPYFEELTGELEVDSVDITTVLPFDDVPSTSRGGLFRFGSDVSSSSSDLLSTPPGAVRRVGRQRSASPASSHSSDVILVSEQKPYRARTPIEISSGSEPETRHNKPITGTRLLSESSSDSDRIHASSPKRKSVHKRFHTPSLSESSEYGDQSSPQPSTSRAQPSTSAAQPSTSAAQPSTSAAHPSSSHAQLSTSAAQRSYGSGPRKRKSEHKRFHFPSSSDSSDDEMQTTRPSNSQRSVFRAQRAAVHEDSDSSDCMVLFEAAKPRHLTESLHRSPESKKNKKSKKDKSTKHQRLKRDWSSERDGRKSIKHHKHHKHVLADRCESSASSHHRDTSSTKRNDSTNHKSSSSRTGYDPKHKSLKSKKRKSSNSRKDDGSSHHGSKHSTTKPYHRDPKCSKSEHDKPKSQGSNSKSEKPIDDAAQSNQPTVTQAESGSIIESSMSNSRERKVSTREESEEIDVGSPHTDVFPSAWSGVENAPSSSSVRASSPVVDVVGLDEEGESSKQDESEWFLDYSQNSYKHQETKEKNSSKDIRKQVRYFVKNNIAGKYQDRSYKKHPKGHKNSNK